MLSLINIFICSICVILLYPTTITAADYRNKISDLAKRYESQVIDWRRDFHQYPELSNREFETSKKIFNILKDLDLDVRYGYTPKGFKKPVGVIGILKGKKPGLTIALRADIDALPVTEDNHLTFRSKQKASYGGLDVGVMHACGHDSHIAMLLGAAKILSELKEQISGNIVFIFQPAEEGTPNNEKGGANLLVEQGVLNNPKTAAVFGIHISSMAPVDTVMYRKKGFMAASNAFKVKIKGRPGHGSRPWTTNDPIVAAAYFITNLQTIVSRKLNLTENPAVVTVGKISGGTRSNIIPETVTLEGTIRTFDENMKQTIFKLLNTMAEGIETMHHVSVNLDIFDGYLVTYNNETLTNKMLPTLASVVGKNNVQEIKPITGSEDFSEYAKRVPGLFVMLGAKHPKYKNKQAAGHHTPKFLIDEKALKTGMELHANIALDFLNQQN